MNVLSLFDGIGVAGQALKEAGIEARLFAVEIDPVARKVSDHHHSPERPCDDVTQLTEDALAQLPRIDVLVGGPPCQGFSIAGKRLLLDDPRSQMVVEYDRVRRKLLELNPDLYWVMENVPMPSATEDVVSEWLGVHPLTGLSAAYGAQGRKRKFWCSPNRKITLKTELTRKVTKDIMWPLDDPTVIAESLMYLSRYVYDENPRLGEIISRGRKIEDVMADPIHWTLGGAGKHYYELADPKLVIDGGNIIADGKPTGKVSNAMARKMCKSPMPWPPRQGERARPADGKSDTVIASSCSKRIGTYLVDSDTHRDRAPLRTHFSGRKSPTLVAGHEGRGVGGTYVADPSKLWNALSRSKQTFPAERKSASIDTATRTPVHIGSSFGPSKGQSSYEDVTKSATVMSKSDGISSAGAYWTSLQNRAYLENGKAMSVNAHGSPRNCAHAYLFGDCPIQLFFFGDTVFISRTLIPREVELLFNLADGYTDCGLSKSVRYRLLGNSFDCAIVADIMRQMDNRTLI